MTQPTSVNMTFDTSLIDLNPNASFSTTESDPSDFGTIDPSTTTPTVHQQSLFDDQSQETPKQPQAHPSTMTSPPPKTSTPVQHMPTEEAYDQWATVYDTDGNMLQAIDDIQLSTLLPSFLTQVQQNTPSAPLSLVDLGCGTGRNTFRLLSLTSSPTTITGLDFSSGMLSIASPKRSLLPATERERIHFHQTDCFPSASNASASPFPSFPNATPFSAALSTLVLEHVPLAPFFGTLRALLVPRGYALVTNMHADMGRVSQAGFVNALGVKVRASSFAHELEETVRVAEELGFEVLGRWERGVEREDLEMGRVGERGGKWVGIKVWFGVLLRRGV